MSSSRPVNFLLVYRSGGPPGVVVDSDLDKEIAQVYFVCIEGPREKFIVEGQASQSEIIRLTTFWSRLDKNNFLVKSLCTLTQILSHTTDQS